MVFNQDFKDWKFPRFLQGPYLKTALTLLPKSANSEVYVMVPYLIQSEMLHSILDIPKSVAVTILTRDYTGYLPNIKSGAQPALNQLKKADNVRIYINNDIHAKILLIDRSFSIVHSMNGTPRSENTNYEAGIVAIDKDVIDETYQYLQFVMENSQEYSPT